MSLIRSNNFENIPPDSPLIEMINYLLAEVDSTKTSKKRRQLLKAASVVLSLPAGVPFISLAQQFAGEDRPVYGNFLAAGTVLCYANLALFSYLNLVDQVGNDFNPSRLKLLNRSKSTMTLKWSASFILAALSCAPSMYLAYTYNGGNPAWPIVNFVSSMGFRTFGFSLALDDLMRQTSHSCSATNTANNKFQKNLSLWGYYTPRSIKRMMKTNTDFLQIEDKENQTQEIINFANNLIDDIAKFDEGNRPVSSAITTSCKFFGGLLPVAQITLNGILAYKASQLIVEDPFFGAFFCAVTLVPDAVIEIKSSRNMVEDCIYMAHGAIKGDDFAKNAKFFSPILSVLLYSMAISVAAFSYGASAFAIKDNFTTDQSQFLLPLFIMADVSFHLYILFSNMSSACESMGEFSRDPNKKIMAEKSRFFRNISQTLTNIQENKLNELILKNDQEMVALEEVKLESSSESSSDISLTARTAST